LKMARMAHEVSRLSAKMREVGLAANEADWLECNRLMLQQALLSQMGSYWSTTTMTSSTTTPKGRGRTTDATGTACTSQWRTGPLGPSTYVPLRAPSLDLARATQPRLEVSTSCPVVVMAVITVRVRNVAWHTGKPSLVITNATHLCLSPARSS
jgi:hypothetical protein